MSHRIRDNALCPRARPAANLEYMKRLAPVFTLYLLAPLIGEFLLGSTPADKAVGLLVEAPLYGGGALLIREAARRLNRGWPTIFLLGLAYGVVEEGLITQSLFNRGYADASPLIAYGHGIPWAVFVLSLHTIWSIATPIALTELIFPDRRAEPWLHRKSIAVAALLWAASALVLAVGIRRGDSSFQANATQSLGALAGAVVLVAAALAQPRPRTTPRTTLRPVPAPWLVALIGVLVGGAFLGVHAMVPRHLRLPWPTLLVMDGVLLVVLLATLARYSTTRHWRREHTVACVAAALISYAWAGYQVIPHRAIDYAGQSVAALAAVVGIWLLLRRYPRWRSRPHVLPAAPAGNPAS